MNECHSYKIYWKDLSEEKRREILKDIKVKPDDNNYLATITLVENRDYFDNVEEIDSSLDLF